MIIDIRPDRNFKLFKQKVLKKLGVRIDALKSTVVYMAAEYLLRETYSKIPNDPQFIGYKESIKLVEITGMKQKGSAYAVISQPKHAKITETKDTKTIIRVVANRRRVRGIPESVRILEKYGPWTPDTIPFLPKKSEALVVSRQVTGRHAAVIARQRDHDRPLWRNELEAVGIRVGSKKRVSRGPGRLTAIPDTYFLASRLEFGLHGTKPAAHWRPSLGNLKTQGSKIITNHNVFIATFDPKYNGWKKWPPSDISVIDTKAAKRLDNFQKLIGI